VKPKATLLRLVREWNGRIVFDEKAQRSGRGAYICPERECVERALQRGRLAHAFRKPCDASAELVAEMRAAARVS
jgi:predicted RNA-binding protein YlxR (DUF448 family)